MRFFKRVALGESNMYPGLANEFNESIDAPALNAARVIPADWIVKAGLATASSESFPLTRTKNC